MKVFLVRDPQQSLDDEMRGQFQKSKARVEVLDFDFLDDFRRVEIQKFFVKYVPKEQYLSQGESYYDFCSELTQKRFKSFTDGYADINYEVRKVNGELENSQTLTKRIKINMFNPNDQHYFGLHLALLFMECKLTQQIIQLYLLLCLTFDYLCDLEEEESWFCFDDVYMYPNELATGILGGSSESKIEFQNQKHVYKIKLISRKLPQRKQEIVVANEGDEIQQANTNVEIVDRHELEMRLQTSIDEIEAKNDRAKVYFKNKQFPESTERFRKLGIETTQLVNKYKKMLEPSNSFLEMTRQLRIKIGQNFCASACKTSDWVKVDEGSKEILKDDCFNKKGLYFEAKARFKLAYFSEAELLIRKYLEKFPDDVETYETFKMYLETINKKKEQAESKEKKMCEKIINKLQEEKKREKIQQIDREQMEETFKKGKEQIIGKILNAKGYEFGNSDFDLLEKLDEEQMADIEEL